MTPSVLFARRTSVYFQLSSDVWDERRDARGYRGPSPVVAHPPCRAWGKFKARAKPLPHERDLALFAVASVRRFGGVLEHPVGSGLWAFAGLPSPGEFDSFGGFTLKVCQLWWGHRAEKQTLLYVVGCTPGDVPPYPNCWASPVTTVERMCLAERERTPPAFAMWLLALASRCHA